MFSNKMVLCKSCASDCYWGQTRQACRDVAFFKMWLQKFFLYFCWNVKCPCFDIKWLLVTHTQKKQVFLVLQTLNI